MSKRCDATGQPLNNITKEDVAAFVNSLKAKDTPWSLGCAALLTTLWAEVEHNRYADIEHETLGCHVAKTGIYAAASETLPRGDGMSAGRFHCACVFSRPTDFAESVLIDECAYHAKLAARSATRLTEVGFTNGTCDVIWDRDRDPEHLIPGAILYVYSDQLK